MGGKGSGRKLKPRPACTTNYALAWEKFTESEDYKRISAGLINRGVFQPYLDNVLKCAFEAGWTATKTRIQIIELPKTQQGG